VHLGQDRAHNLSAGRRCLLEPALGRGEPICELRLGPLPCSDELVDIAEISTKGVLQPRGAGEVAAMETAALRRTDAGGQRRRAV
jgi:hypothetical protein